MYIGFPVGGLLITAGIIFLLKALGCILGEESYWSEKKYGAINDDIEEEYEDRWRGINASMSSSGM